MRELSAIRITKGSIASGNAMLPRLFLCASREIPVVDRIVQRVGANSDVGPQLKP
jgi:hypothetical protein